MTRRRSAAVTTRIWTLVVLVLLASGCGAGEDAGSSGQAAETLDRPTPGPLALPDLSRLAESAQAQVRERYAVLQRLQAVEPVEPVELADAYGAVALILMAVEFDEAAEVGYQHAQALAPDDRRWPYYLGHLYRMRGEAAQAAERFERALELQPTDLATLIWLGRQHLDAGRPEAAAPLFEQALALDPAAPAALSGAGRAAVARREYERATEYLERALTVDETASSVRYPLAMAYQAVGQAEAADAHLARRGTGQPTLPDPLMAHYDALLRSPAAFERRGLDAFAAGRWEEATAAFREGLELEPENPSLRHRLGSALLMVGDAASAVAQFEETLRRSPRFAKAHFSLGMIHDANGRRRAAIERFSDAVRYQPDYVEARFGLAEALRVAGRLEESLPHYRQAVSIAPGFAAEVWLGGADALIRLNRYQEAREWLAEAMAAYPDRSELGQLDEVVTTFIQLNRPRER